MPYKNPEKQKAAMRETMRRQRAKLVTFSESTAAVILWMENVARKGYSLPLNLAIVQTPESLFYRSLTLGSSDVYALKTLKLK
jgi:hypothetical protein